MVRASIRQFLIPYLERFGQEIGTDDPTEIVNQIVFEHMRGVRQACVCGDRGTLSGVSVVPPVTELDELAELLG